MRYNTIQQALDYIDAHIGEPMTLEDIALTAGYSKYHFSRMFSQETGISVRRYVTRRKLEFAAHRLSGGSRILDVALEYGFETHAGFTKAFRACFGYPPSLCFLRAGFSPPKRATPWTIKRMRGTPMHAHLLELTPFSAIGYPSRHAVPAVKHTADIPTFWNTQNLDTAGMLTKLHSTFTHSKHFEVCLCYDVDDATGEFTYLLGRGIDNPADFAAMDEGMLRLDIPGGLYAIFSTPPADDYIQVVQDT